MTWVNVSKTLQNRARLRTYEMGAGRRLRLKAKEPTLILAFEKKRKAPQLDNGSIRTLTGWLGQNALASAGSRIFASSASVKGGCTAIIPVPRKPSRRPNSSTSSIRNEFSIADLARPRMKAVVSRRSLIGYQANRAAAPFGMGSRQCMCETRQFIALLEGWVDQHQPAAFLGWDVGGQRGPAVDRDCLDARVASQVSCERIGRSGFQFAGDQPVLGAQEMPDQERRTRIAPQRAVRVETAQGFPIGR